MKIGNKSITQDSSVYIIAEMSANHEGSLKKAIEIVHVAKECGADAVKLQTFKPDKITLNCDNEDFQISNASPWKDYKTKYNIYKKGQLPWEWHQEIIEAGNNIGIEVFSAPFDLSAIDFLESMQVKAYKIASPEINDLPLIEKAGRTGKPVILSTGLAEIEDISLAIKTLENAGCTEYALLKCTTAYPTPFEEINLKTIPNMIQTFGCICGLSDHSKGIAVPIASVCLGARIIEKHFTLDKSSNSMDSFFSLNPTEFENMVTEIRNVEKALGTVSYKLSETAQKNYSARRSLYISKDIVKGSILTEENCQSVRPGYGLHPKFYYEILGKKVTMDLKKGDRISWDVIE